MAVAWLVTALAIVGVLAGVFLHQSRWPSSHFAAAGSGLLFGIALFWLLPEVSEIAGWLGAALMLLAVAGLLGLIDSALTHSGQSPRRGVVWPLLAATALHSFLDGWSVRALATQPPTRIAVPVGLALHKIPEGLAMGWITRRSTSSHGKAVAAASAAELFTLAGALAQPAINNSGMDRFGAWWTAVVMSIIGGGFLFLGFHAVLPHRRRADVIVVFLATLLLVWSLHR
jgi:zinc transporter ZupT